jgi:hypothetical protein
MIDRNRKGRQASKLIASQIPHIRKATGPLKDIAAMYGVSVALISMIRNKRVWQHVE